jgi:dipeptidase
MELSLEGAAMGCDSVVVLGRATADGLTLFGQYSDADPRRGHTPCRTVSRSFTPGEKVFTQYLELPQARQVYAVLGRRPSGVWGYESGVNEHQVGAACVRLRPALRCNRPGLLGTDLVRLVLERSRNARQAVELLTDLVERYGQGAFPNCPADAEHDNAFLIADGAEAYAVETAGTHWVYQEIREVRVVSSVRIVRQDWDRISHGLASLAFAEGWWPEDGSKLDFSGALGENPRDHEAALRRWGQATMLLLEQSGHIDAAFLRRILHQQAEELPEERPAVQPPHHAVWWRPLAAVTTSMIAQLRSDYSRLPVIWWAVGLPGAEIHIPLFLGGDLPASVVSGSAASGTGDLATRLRDLGDRLGGGPQLSPRVRERFAALQTRLDQDAEEYAAEGAAFQQRESPSEFQRQTSLFMQYNMERLEEALADALLLLSNRQTSASDTPVSSATRTL